MIRSERTKQMEQILNFQVPAEGLELIMITEFSYKIKIGKILIESWLYSIKFIFCSIPFYGK